jgi:hypothetical protein
MPETAWLLFSVCIRRSRLVPEIPAPGRTRFTREIPIRTESAVMMTVKKSDLTPTRPILCTSLKSATPRTIAVNMRGIMIIKISLKKTCPKGYETFETIH